MKKVIIVLASAAFLTSCDNELEEVCNQYEEVSAAKDEKKVNPNFLIFKDRTQSGKGETR
jgi:hypothetical protein